jgi:uncharacterized protein DUF4031
MSVYVDDMRAKFGRMVMCHLWADTEAELFAMVDAIGVQRKWLQTEPKASWTHFDISLAKKEAAIKLGAIITDKFGPMEHVAKLDIASGDPTLVEYGKQRLERVAKARAMRAIA